MVVEGSISQPSQERVHGTPWWIDSSGRKADRESASPASIWPFWATTRTARHHCTNGDARIRRAAVGACRSDDAREADGYLGGYFTKDTLPAAIESQQRPSAPGRLCFCSPVSPSRDIHRISNTAPRSRSMGTRITRSAIPWFGATRFSASGWRSHAGA